MKSVRVGPDQALLIFSMLFGEEQDEREPMQSSCGIKAAPRDALVKAGLILKDRRTTAKGSSAQFLLLTDEAWDWAVSNLDAPVSDPVPRKRKNEDEISRIALHGALAKLKRFLTTHDHALAEFVRADADGQSNASDPQHEAPVAPKVSKKRALPSNALERKHKAPVAPKVSRKRARPSAPRSRTKAQQSKSLVSAGTLEARVRQACLDLAHGNVKERVRLKDLRRKVRASRAVMDQALTAMQNSGKLVLMRLDNPAELTREDAAAALSIAGNPRHLVYLEA